MTEDEEIAYDSGLIDGRVAERARVAELEKPAYERGYADGEDTGREAAKEAIKALYPQTYGSYEQGLTDALAAIDGLAAAKPNGDPVANERYRILRALEITIGVYGGYYPVVVDALLSAIEVIDKDRHAELKALVEKAKENVR
jgi:hypothetical protein